MQPMSQNPVAVAPEADDASVVAAALGRIPSGLFIVTWRHGDQDRGMLVSWLMQAGFEPPAVSVAVGRGRDLLDAIAAGRSFVVNVLAESQRQLLGRFARPAEEAFAGLPLFRPPCGAAAFADAAAWLECRPMIGRSLDAMPGGDHLLVVAEVTAAGGATGLPPLVHVRRSGLRY